MRVVLTGVLAILCVGGATAQTDNSARQQLIETLDQIANKQLAETGADASPGFKLARRSTSAKCRCAPRSWS